MQPLRAIVVALSLSLAFAPVVLGQDGAPSERQLYVARLGAILQRGWSLPATFPAEERAGLRAIVAIEVGADGAIHAWRFQSPSGSATFDELVAAHLARVIASHPSIPPPPASVASEPLGWTFLIRFIGSP